MLKCLRLFYHHQKNEAIDIVTMVDELNKMKTLDKAGEKNTSLMFSILYQPQPMFTIMWTLLKSQSYVK